MSIMKDKRAIIIKNPRLQTIRNNFRTLFLKAINTELIRLLNERQNLKIDSDGISRSIDDLPPNQLKKYRQLQEQENNLRESSYRSILACVSCGKSDRDMVYNKAYDAWYCTECYRLHQSYAKELQQRQKGKDKTKPQGHEEKTIDELYKTFL
jgi:ABC-type phosphate transport system auxiliary subunit